jgi:hypothetical protein
MYIWFLWFTAVVVAGWCLRYAYKRPHTQEYMLKHILIVALWTLGPPTWFLAESAFRITWPEHWPHKNNEKLTDGELTPQEKYFYESAATFWAGVLALLTAIYAKDKLIDKPTVAPAEAVEPELAQMQGQLSRLISKLKDEHERCDHTAATIDTALAQIAAVENALNVARDQVKKKLENTTERPTQK